MVNKFLSLTLFIVITLASQAFCDTIYLKNGRFLKGKIIRQTRTSVTIQRKTGKQKVLRVNIKKITRSKAAVKQAPVVPVESEQLAAPTEEASLAAPEESSATAAPEESPAAAVPEENEANSTLEESEAVAAPEESEPATASEESAAAGITQSQWNAERLAKQNAKMWTWGIDAGGDMWTMDGKEFLKTLDSYKAEGAPTSATMTGKVTQGKLGGFIGVFVERGGQLRLGAALGYGVMPVVSFKFRYSDSGAVPFTSDKDLENKITYIPLDLYIKRTSSSGKLVLFGGGGASYVMASTDFKFKDEAPSVNYSYSGKATFTQKKVIPHVQAGGELFLSESISLNFSAKYLFSAVLDKLTGDLKANGESDGKHRMIMRKGPYGETFSSKGTSSPLASNERPFKYDLSGLRINLTARYYFGGR